MNVFFLNISFALLSVNSIFIAIHERMLLPEFVKTVDDGGSFQKRNGENVSRSKECSQGDSLPLGIFHSPAV